MNVRLVPIIGLLLLSACASEEARIKEQIAEANYCETAEDCVDTGSKCPFGCYIYVNDTEAGRIKTLVDGYDSTCQYACIAISGVECVQNKCQPIEQAPTSEQSAEGNPGTACTDHSDCVTPMDYLIRSMCPFRSRCIDGTCSVVCPMMSHDPVPSTPVACTADSQCRCEGMAADRFNCKCVDQECVAVMEHQ